MDFDMSLVILIAALAYVVFAICTRRGRRANIPPGPRPYPLIGNLPQLSGSHSYLVMSSLSEQYGDIYSLTFPGGQKAVVINSAALAREALLKKKDDFSGRPFTFIGDAITRGTADIICADFTQTMVNLRKIVHSALKMYGHGLQRLEDTICSEGDEIAKRFLEHNGEPVDPKADICVAVLNVICALVYGQRYDMHDPEFERIVDYNDKFVEIFGSYNVLDLMPWLRFFPLRTMKLMEDARNTRDEIINKKYKEHKEKFEIENANNNFEIQDLTDALLQAFNAENKDTKSPLTEDNIMMTMNDIFNAGFETTSTTLRWILLLLIRYPEVQEKVHKELDEIIGPGRLPRLKDRRQLPYLEAVIAETLRITSLVPLALPHKATKDTTLAGYDIPKGTLLIPNVWRIHHRPDEWKDPDQFEPERFLDDQGNYESAGVKAFLPFGVGRRNCIGESLAKRELFLISSRLLHQFVFKNPTGAPLPSLEGNQGVVIHPKPFKMVVEERPHKYWAK